MRLLTNHEPAFTQLISDEVPKYARWDPVRELMKKYTSGYLTSARLDKAMRADTLPTMAVGVVGGGASGEQWKDDIVIDTAYFTEFKKGTPLYGQRVLVTVLHEVAHWGYWKGQEEGNKSDKAGRSHNNHGDYKSPLNADLETLLGTLAILTAGRLGMF